MKMLLNICSNCVVTLQENGCITVYCMQADTYRIYDPYRHWNVWGLMLQLAEFEYED